MKSNLRKRGIAFCFTLVFFGLAILPAIETSSLMDYSLPSPIDVDMILEESIFRRMSVREFTDEPVTDEELSTILWASYGLRDDGKRTVSAIDGIHAAVIYVLKEDAAYTYDALNHSLALYKEGDYRDIVGWQYSAPIQLGLCWDTDKTDICYAGVELGEIGQNIHFMANALDLGTVVTAQGPNSAIEPLGLPDNEEGMIVMPLGHPKYPYNFIDKPRWISLLPRIQYSDVSLTTAIQEREEPTSWSGELTKQEQTQLIWASYGYSYFLDDSNNTIGRLDRHRTVPSAHGYYPLQNYVVTESGIYLYFPNFYNPVYGLLRGIWNLPVVTFLMKIKNGDYREDVAQASSNPSIASAPLLIISVLDVDKTIRWDDLSGMLHIWYYEAGASAHNILLEATAWDLSGNIEFPSDVAAIRSLFKLSDDFVPLLIVPIGR